jgi:predicted nucleic acid-binding Zn ribbon protein
MRKIREFLCGECCEISALLVEDEITETNCKHCKGLAKRIISAVAGRGNAAHGFLKRSPGFKN